MLWDEPTNHLDLRHAHDGLALLRDLGLTAVVVLHDLNLAARYADRALLLVDGRSVAAGPIEDVLTPALVRAAFGIGATATRHLGAPQLLFARDREGVEAEGVTTW
jgi:iron complex transport system ATP-binding protein